MPRLDAQFAWSHVLAPKRGLTLIFQNTNKDYESSTRTSYRYAARALPVRRGDRRSSIHLTLLPHLSHIARQSASKTGTLYTTMKQCSASFTTSVVYRRDFSTTVRNHTKCTGFDPGRRVDQSTRVLVAYKTIYTMQHEHTHRKCHSPHFYESG